MENDQIMPFSDILLLRQLETQKEKCGLCPVTQAVYYELIRKAEAIGFEMQPLFETSDEKLSSPM